MSLGKSWHRCCSGSKAWRYLHRITSSIFFLTLYAELQAECAEQLGGLQQHLLTLEDLHHRFLSYQTAFNKLLVEIARRRMYQEAAENIVKGIMNQMEAMTEGWLYSVDCNIPLNPPFVVDQKKVNSVLGSTQKMVRISQQTSACASKIHQQNGKLCRSVERPQKYFQLLIKIS